MSNNRISESRLARSRSFESHYFQNKIKGDTKDHFLKVMKKAIDSDVFYSDIKKEFQSSFGKKRNLNSK